MFTDEEVQTWLLENCESYAQGTQEYYSQSLTYLRAWLIQKGLEPEALTLIKVKEWMDFRGWSPNTRYGASCALRGFFRWRYGISHPLSNFHLRRVDPGPQRTLEEEEVKAVFDYLENEKVKDKVWDHFNKEAEKTIRDKAIFAFMIDTGVRAGELCNLTMDKLNLKSCSAFVFAKGGEWQEKVYSELTANLIKQWLDIRSRLIDPGYDKVFCSIGGRNRGHPLTVDGLRVMFLHLSEAVGIELFSPHALRRTMATLAILNGAPTRLVQLQGGWKNIQLVERYTKKLTARDFQGYFPVKQEILPVTSRSQKTWRLSLLKISEELGFDLWHLLDNFPPFEEIEDSKGSCIACNDGARLMFHFDDLLIPVCEEVCAMVFVADALFQYKGLEPIITPNPWK